MTGKKSWLKKEISKKYSRRRMGKFPGKHPGLCNRPILNECWPSHPLPCSADMVRGFLYKKAHSNYVLFKYLKLKLSKRFFQKLTSMCIGLRNFKRCALCNNIAAFVATFWAEVNDVIDGFYYV
ncbi:MAG: hypothetical protein US87_C0001G0074 [Candidatus Falkowbacteria bacterium GW2011_GWE2_38_254]|nr:MAG: hypothetical protein US87_C0001G0074 [Candidatus Falkowbacteria bacterium GW2011_GWE2_38_254]